MNLVTALINSHRKRVTYVSLLICLAVLVTLGVGAVFHQTGITKTYQKTVLTCTAEPQSGPGYAGFFVHRHNDDCYDEENNLVCTLKEIEAHEHDASCYSTVQELICEIPESEGHTHTEDCHALVRGALACGQEESETHQHTDACYTWTEELTCGLQEGEGAHRHDASCYQSVTKLTCDKPVVILHTHTDECYTLDEDENPVLICGKTEVTEHVHGAECFTVYELDDGEPEETETPAATEPTDAPPAEQSPSVPPEGEPENVPAENTEGTDTEDIDPVEAETEKPADGADTGTETKTEDGTETVTETGNVPEPEKENKPREIRMLGSEKGGATVQAEVPEGILPEGARLSLEDYSTELARAVILSVVNENAAEGEERSISSIYAIDIGFAENGVTVSPNGEEPIRVTLRAKELRGMTDPKLYHLVNGTAERINNAQFDTAAGTVVFSSREFSPFAVVELTGEDPVSVSMPAQQFHGWTDEVDVYVEADEGAFPAGTTMVVTPVAQEAVIDALNEAVTDAMVRNVQAVDISFYDADGNEIEPATAIRVKMSKKAAEAAAPVENSETKESVVMHVDTEGSAQRVENATVDSATAEFESDSFSTYVMMDLITEEYLDSEGNAYNISVSYGPEAKIPDGADLAVEEILDHTAQYSEYVAKTENALGIEEGSAGYIRLFDISIVNRENPAEKYQPADGTTVDVKISLADAQQDNSLSVVHFADGSEAGNVIENTTENTAEGQVVSFAAEGFSVYAVVGDGENVDESRTTVNFYGKDTSTPIATVYVKNSDTAEDIESIVFDPGCGTLDNSKKELFDGWVISTVNTTDGSSYTIETEGKTIEEVRALLESMDISEGDVVNIYAKIVRSITVSYEGENENTLLGTVSLKVLGSDDPNSSDNIAEYTVNMNYTPETATQAFMGWNVAAGATNIISATYNDEAAVAPYTNGTKLTLKGDVTLSVHAPTGHWLVFDENGKGATYNAPRFIKDGDTTSEPSLEMVRLGYSFDGWYKLKENVSIEAVEKDSDGNYIITDSNFEAFVFNQELSDNTTVYAKWTAAEKANYTVIVWKERMTDTYAENGGTGDGKTKNYDFAESYTFEGNVGDTIAAVSRGTSSVTDGDESGTVYYDARIQGTNSTGTSTDKTISFTGYHCTDYDTEVKINPEGTSVINVYYDRNTVTYTFYTYGSSTSGGDWRLCREDGTVHTGDIAVLKPGGNPNNARDYEQFYGTPRYGDGRTYYYSTTGSCNGDVAVVRELHWEYKNNSGNSWNVYQESTGLYGEALNWPTDTSIWWYEDHNATTGTGTRMTYKDAFLPLGEDMKVEYWGNKASASGTIHFWTQDVDGEHYTDQVQVNTGNANFNINDKFTGFYAVQYSTDGGSWRNVGDYNQRTGIYGSPVSYSNRLDIRYDRIKAPITFLDGSYFDGNGNRMNEDPQAEAFYTSPEYYYEADVSSYNRGGSNYYTPPEKAGYTFAGWYADDACTVPYDFNTMPATGITVYAKWIQNEYRVFLHSNVPETDTTLSWGSADQNMNFRVSSGQKVSAPTGTRSGYRFIGWYFDEDCTEVFDADKFILNDTSVTTPYDKSVDFTDPMNKYGNIEGSGTNSDLTGYNGSERFWITRKLDLYAKWRAELIGAEGIGVKYDPNGGSNAPSDTTLYLDNTDTVAQGATTPPDATQQFLYWVLQRWDNTHENPDGTTGAFVDIEGEDGRVYPGETFTVLKDNSLIEELEGSTEEDPKYRYTVQLRAQYGPKDEPTPTHLTWYANGGIAADNVTDRYTDPELQINQAVDIKAADTFTRDGYSFLGWAKVDTTPADYEIEPRELGEDDLFLKYENGAFYAQITDGSEEWSEVTRVAADEKNPYHDLYAVWQKKTYTVSVTKYVTGMEEDEEIPFTFTPYDLGDSSAFRLVGKEDGVDIEQGDESIHIEHTKVFGNIPYGTEIRVQEQMDDRFSISELYSIRNADNTDENVDNSYIENGTGITVNGDVEIIYTNTRKTIPLRIQKTEPDNQTPLGGAVFTTTVDGISYTFTSDANDGFLKNETYADGSILIPFGEYTFSESTAPNGYIPLESDVTFTVNESGVLASPYRVKAPEGDVNYYTLIIPNNPGVELPQTGGRGTCIYYITGLGITLIGGILLIRKRKWNSARGAY